MSSKIEKMLVQAFENVEDGNYSDALKLYDLALKEEPENTGILVDKGATLQNMGKIKMAIRTYDKATCQFPLIIIDALLNKGAALHYTLKKSMMNAIMTAMMWR